MHLTNTRLVTMANDEKLPLRNCKSGFKSVNSHFSEKDIKSEDNQNHINIKNLQFCLFTNQPTTVR